MTNLAQLVSFLEQDPDNTALRLDCVNAAIEADDLHTARAYLKPLLEIEHVNAQGLLGTILLHERDYVAAETIFADLIRSDQGDPALHFNHAWSLSHLGRHVAAFETLTDETVRTLPQAAMLHVQLLHELGRFEEAAEASLKHIDRFPDHSGLLAAGSTIAMDTHNPDRASTLAHRAPDHPGSQVTLGSLALANGQTEEADRLFKAALSQEPDAPRALIGKGLACILTNDLENAAIYLDRGAERFGTHLGSWIAAGWAYALSGDYDSAAERFQKAESIDDTFAEVQGSLGALNILSGHHEDGKRRIRAARRLDANSPTAALGQLLLMQEQGREDTARDIFAKALDTPINETGTTLGQAMVQIGTGH